MIRTDLLQGTAEWLKFRNNRIGASDFCVIASHYGLCKSIFSRSLATMIQDKITAKKQEDNMFFAIGRELEPIIIKSIPNVELQVGEVFVYDKDDRLMASLDGRDVKDNVVIEVKTTSKTDPDKLAAQYHYYKYQVVHQCYCANTTKGLLLIAKLDTDKKITEQLLYEINPAEILSKEGWLAMCSDVLMQMQNYYDETHNRVIAEYMLIDIEIEELKLRKEKIKDGLVELYPNGCVNSKFNLSKIDKTTAQYAKYIKDYKIKIPIGYQTTTTSYTLKLKGE